MATYEEPDTSNAVFNEVRTLGKFLSTTDGNRAKTKAVSIPMLMLISSLIISTQLVRETLIAIVGASGNYHNNKPEIKFLLCINHIILILVAPVIGYLSDKAVKGSGSRLKYLRRAFFLGVLGLIIFILSKYQSTNWGHYYTTATVIALIIFYIWMSIFTTIVEIIVRLLITDYAGENQVLGSVFCQIWISVVSTLSSHRDLRYPNEAMLRLMGILILANGFVAITCVIEKLEYMQVHSGIAQIFPPEFGFYDERKFNSLQACCLAIIMFLTTYSHTMYDMYVSIEVKSAILHQIYGKVNGSPDRVWEEKFSSWPSHRGIYLQTETLILTFFICLCILALPKLVRKFGCKKLIIVFLIPQALILILFISVNKDIFLLVHNLVPLTTMVLSTLSVPYLRMTSGENADIGLGVGCIFATQSFAQVLPQIFDLALGFYGYYLPLFAASAAIILAFGFSAVLLQNKA